MTYSAVGHATPASVLDTVLAPGAVPYRSAGGPASPSRTSRAPLPRRAARVVGAGTYGFQTRGAPVGAELNLLSGWAILYGPAMTDANTPLADGSTWGASASGR